MLTRCLKSLKTIKQSIAVLVLKEHATRKPWVLFLEVQLKKLRYKDISRGEKATDKV